MFSRGNGIKIQTLTTTEAAAFLNVSPNTLRNWERRFGFPTPLRPTAGHRRYPRTQLSALRAALSEGLTISSAVSAARDAHGSDVGSLVAALTSCRLPLADSVMEASLAIRSLEQSLDAILLPALEHIHGRHGDTSALWAFAAMWADDWFARAKRFTLLDEPTGTILIGGTLSALDPTRLYVHGLTLCLARRGWNALVLSATAIRHVPELVDATGAEIIVVAGQPDDVSVRWAYELARVKPDVLRLQFAPHLVGDATANRRLLPRSPVQAARDIVSRLADRPVSSAC